MYDSAKNQQSIDMSDIRKPFLLFWCPVMLSHWPDVVELVYGNLPNRSLLELVRFGGNNQTRLTIASISTRRRLPKIRAMTRPNFPYMLPERTESFVSVIQLIIY